jgi:hypothetical protein
MMTSLAIAENARIYAASARNRRVEHPLIRVARGEANRLFVPRRSKNGVASLAYGRSNDSVTTPAHGRSTNDVAMGPAGALSANETFGAVRQWIPTT